MVSRQEVAYFYHLRSEEVTKENPIWSPLTEVFLEFKEIFGEPTELPPYRALDHHITLTPGTIPINVHPYYYPHFQKNEIECLTKEMLHQGLIRPSTSPFFSPVLLVRKKDGSWCFCVDYQTLNAATVCDRFPIPTIDELFDELHGSALFSKLDLRSGVSLDLGSR